MGTITKKDEFEECLKKLKATAKKLNSIKDKLTSDAPLQKGEQLADPETHTQDHHSIFCLLTSTSVPLVCPFLLFAYSLISPISAPQFSFSPAATLNLSIPLCLSSLIVQFPLRFIFSDSYVTLLLIIPSASPLKHHKSTCFYLKTKTLHSSFYFPT